MPGFRRFTPFQTTRLDLQAGFFTIVMGRMQPNASFPPNLELAGHRIGRIPTDPVGRPHGFGSGVSDPTSWGYFSSNPSGAALVAAPRRTTQYVRRMPWLDR